MLKKFSIDEQYNSKFITIGAKIINFFLLLFLSPVSRIALSSFCFSLLPSLSHSHHQFVSLSPRSRSHHLLMLPPSHVVHISISCGGFFFFFLSWVSMVRFKGEWVLMGVGGFPQVRLVASGFRWVSGTILGWAAPVLDGFWVGFCGGWLVIACGRVLLLLWFFFFFNNKRYEFLKLFKWVMW